MPLSRNIPARPHPLTRSKAASRADAAIARMWERGLTDKPPLDPEFLWAKGSKGYSLEDEQSVRSPEDIADFRERLEALCKSVREEAGLNSLGHTMAYGQITSAIRKRHALGKLWREKPSLCETPIAAPIIVVGQMRAGTTRMQRLLAADPAHCGTRFCNSHDPIPRIFDIRPVASTAFLKVARSVNPWLDALHPFGATRTDEEIGWLAAALSPCAIEAQWRIPSYVSWSEARDPTPVYREFARILRTDAVSMGNANRPRALKCPQYSEDLPALLEQFPDARLVMTHREGPEVLASSVSMVASQMVPQSDDLAIGDIEAEWRRKLALREERIERALGAFSGAVAHVQFDALNADWLSEIRRVYSELGLEFTDKSETAMQAEHSRSGKQKHAEHKAQIASFTND